MKSVIVVVSVLALAHQAFATSCSAIPEYNTTLVPACAGNDVFVLWPNYQNFSQFYRCQGQGNPVLVDCSENNFFSYYLQICNSCEEFLPAPVCEKLRTSSTPNCVAMDNPTTAAPTTSTTTTVAPTTAAPTTTTATITTAAPTTTTATTTTKAPTTTTATITTKAPTTTKATTTTNAPTTTISDIPAPPSPSTSAPGIPEPPTPAPTPPSVEVTPPSQP